MVNGGSFKLKNNGDANILFRNAWVAPIIFRRGSPVLEFGVLEED